MYIYLSTKFVTILTLSCRLHWKRTSLNYCIKDKAQQQHRQFSLDVSQTISRLLSDQQENLRCGRSFALHLVNYE